MFLILFTSQERNTNYMQEPSQPQVWWFMSVKAKLKRKKKQKAPNRKLPRQGALSLQPQPRMSPRPSTARCEAPGSARGSCVPRAGRRCCVSPRLSPHGHSPDGGAPCLAPRREGCCRMPWPAGHGGPVGAPPSLLGLADLQSSRVCWGAPAAPGHQEISYGGQRSPEDLNSYGFLGDRGKDWAAVGLQDTPWTRGCRGRPVTQGSSQWDCGSCHHLLGTFCPPLAPRNWNFYMKSVFRY
ncbi:uncharacterized protein LOC119520420 [Choloepus didactylus]|uniref:uncharacterized protein LOC119520420 n=1 Tax=Choloepus didactylus TaxID=27675 RepID=UPI00189E4612|nr:uncharacterized protein LOC119520420 [Choloepus didactylus]